MIEEITFIFCIFRGWQTSKRVYSQTRYSTFGNDFITFSIIFRYGRMREDEIVITNWLIS